MNKQIGDGPVSPQFLAKMQHLAIDLDRIFNGTKKGADKTTGFVLMVFAFGEQKEGDAEHRVNYISNSERNDIQKLMREQVERFENQKRIITP